MAAKRREVRETAFILSFEKLFRDESIDDIVRISQEYDDFKIDDEAVRLVKGVLDKQDELDKIIWRLFVLPYMKRCMTIRFRLMLL